MSNFVFIAVSIDGFIARENGSIDWLENIDNPEHSDFGYKEFISKIDAVVMGRKTYESVKNFDPWPYEKPVFVLSKTLPNSQKNNVTIVHQSPKELIALLNSRGFKNLYIDGGKTIQSFLAENLIDEMTITRIPVLLGSGIPLFSHHPIESKWLHFETKAYSNGLVQSTYRRK